MKISIFIALMATSGASAFAPSPTTASYATQLSLFGGGASKDGDAKPGGGMMDQLAMFKKAQEMAKKKQTLDNELASETFPGTAADGKVTVDCKFSPSKNPMDPQPDYLATKFDFDKDWYEAASPEELSTAVQEAFKSGIEATNEAVKAKYSQLEEDIKALQG
jgi:DNA-binding protein YbaB